MDNSRVDREGRVQRIITDKQSNTGVSINRSTPIAGWSKMGTPKMDDDWDYPYFRKHPHQSFPQTVDEERRETSRANAEHRPYKTQDLPPVNPL